MNSGHITQLPNPGFTGHCSGKVWAGAKEYSQCPILFCLNSSGSGGQLSECPAIPSESQLSWLSRLLPLFEMSSQKRKSPKHVSHLPLSALSTFQSLVCDHSYDYIIKLFSRTPSLFLDTSVSNLTLQKLLVRSFECFGYFSKLI